MPKPIKSVISSGWTNFKRNSYLSFAVTGVMTIAILILLGLTAFQYLSSAAVNSLQGKVDVSVYFNTDTSEEKILEVQVDLKNIEDVAEVTYISRDIALTEFKERHRDDKLIQESLDQLDSNPLSASLNILATDPSKYTFIVDFLNDHKLRASMEKINFYENEKVINRIEKFTSTLRMGGIIAVVLITIIAILITFNTVRLTIYNQKQEIEIMRLVGASNWHIRGPYLAEGGIYGLIASVVALAIFYPLLYYASEKMSVFISGTDLFNYFLVNSWQIVLLAVVIGMLIGVVSSFIAIRKHLKI